MSSFEPASLLERGPFVPEPLPSPAGVDPAEPDVAADAPEAATGTRPPERPAAAPPGASVGTDAQRPSGADLEQARREAFDEGYAHGRESLPWREAESLERALQAVEAAAESLAALRREYLAVHRRHVVDLAVAIAERILARAVHEDPEALESLIERGMALLADEEPVCVRLSAQDLAALEAGAAPRLARLASGPGVRFESDPGLEPGDVCVTGEKACVDARLGELLRRIRVELDTSLAAGGVGSE